MLKKKEFFIMLLIVIGISGSIYWNKYNKLSVPKNVMANYLDAFRDKDYDKIKELLYFKNDPEDCINKQIESIEDMELVSYKIKKVKKETDERYIIHYYVNQLPKEAYGEGEYDAYVVKINNVWRVVLNKDQLQS